MIRANRFHRSTSPAMARGTRQERGYDAAWQKVRLAHLQKYPLCQDCQALGYVRPAREVHHKIKIAIAPRLRLDPDNLMSLCRQCHQIRTARGE